MALPHPDPASPSPWDDWPANLPQPTAEHVLDRVDGTAQDIYRVVMPNNAVFAMISVPGAAEEAEFVFTGDWAPYGLRYAACPEDGMDGPGVNGILAALEEWHRQDLGHGCGRCRATGQGFVDGSLGSCPACLGLGWIPRLSAGW